ncbi:hypothetical protein EYF80_045737 [Liparis tanakae]|uniref:Uncharacterized protein n=1 Tax=Liparis tanakae TaxID=230148 RepID=A0A4Z2FUN8_9TELE|nr:hypothetical protein EYF80_045737 [Liparis tanakae]
MSPEDKRGAKLHFFPSMQLYHLQEEESTFSTCVVKQSSGGPWCSKQMSSTSVARKYQPFIVAPSKG